MSGRRRELRFEVLTLDYRGGVEALSLVAPNHC